MRTVMKQQDVVNTWAQQSQAHARSAGKRVFFEGRTIYSYGYHFPMGQFVTNDRGETAVLVADYSLSPSVTTTKHLHAVRMAVLGSTVLHVVVIPPNGFTIRHFKNMKHYRDKRDHALKKWRNARKYNDIWLHDVNEIVIEGNKYAEFFDLPDSVEDPFATVEVRQYYNVQT